MKILVTGANRGIGLEFVRQYVGDGAMVHACCRDPNKAATLKSIKGNVQIHALDVTDPISIDHLAKVLKDTSIDILINNAGIYGDKSRQSFKDTDYNEWMQVFAVNTLAPLRVIQAFHPHLKAAGQAKIITISSQMGALSRMAAGSYAYRSSKTALNKVMQLASIDLRNEGIIVCPVHPGWVRTDMGGDGADIDVQESVAGLKRLIAGLTLEHTGRFFQWDGKEVDW